MSRFLFGDSPDEEVTAAHETDQRTAEEMADYLVREQGMNKRVAELLAKNKANIPLTRQEQKEWKDGDLDGIVGRQRHSDEMAAFDEKFPSEENYRPDFKAILEKHDFTVQKMLLGSGSSDSQPDPKNPGLSKLGRGHRGK